MAQQYAANQPAGFKNHIENIAIIGAGGNIGRNMVEALVALGKHRVTALSRPDGGANLPSGLHAVTRVDYNDHSALVEALRGQEALIITLAVGTPAEVQKRIIDAAAAAGVDYVMPNEYGSDNSNARLAADTLLGNASLGMRAYVEEVGRGRTHWVALSCSFWYEFSLAGSELRYGFDFDRKALTLFDDGHARINTSTWAQCGRAVAALFSLPRLPAREGDASPTLSQFADRAVYISSFLLSQREMLASVLRVTGDREEDWTITSEPSDARVRRGRELMGQGDMLGFALLLYSRMFYPNGDGNFSDKLINEQLGLPQEDLDEATGRAISLHESGVLGIKSYGENTKV